MHYCGTCKTIGSRYGQQARLFLNHDAVFLAELLDALTGADCEQWPRAYRSWNCMRLPGDREMPVLLRYAAAVNVLLGEYKVRDHEADSRHQKCWTGLRRWLSPAFRKAQSDLATFGFPLAECDRILGRQQELEATAGAGAELVAEPTAQVTGLVFRHGARLAGLESKADAIAEVGYRFGRSIYLIDAWQDYDRDVRTGAFNALQSGGAGRDWAAGEIRKEGEAIATAIEWLGAPVEFRLRLKANIESALGSPLRVLEAGRKQSCAMHVRPTMRMRWREAIDRARGWRAPMAAFALVVVMALLFPRYARLARSGRECLSLGLNLMAMGGILAMVPVPGSGGMPRASRSTCGGRECCFEGCCDSCEGCDCCGAGCCCGDACGSCGDCCSGCDCG